jgi:hypothetical protein
MRCLPYISLLYLRAQAARLPTVQLLAAYVTRWEGGKGAHPDLLLPLIVLKLRVPVLQVNCMVALGMLPWCL